MEGRRARVALYPPIKWTPPLEKDLLAWGLEEKTRGRGYQKRLADRWREQHPNLPSSYQALSSKFCRLVKATPVEGLGEAIPNEGSNQERAEETVMASQTLDSVPDPDPPKEMTNELEKVYQATKAEGEGSWKPRSRLTARWRGDKRLLGQIDDAMARVWEAAPCGTSTAYCTLEQRWQRAGKLR